MQRPVFAVEIIHKQYDLVNVRGIYTKALPLADVLEHLRGNGGALDCGGARKRLIHQHHGVRSKLFDDLLHLFALGDKTAVSRGIVCTAIGYKMRVDALQRAKVCARRGYTQSELEQDLRDTHGLNIHALAAAVGTRQNVDGDTVLVKADIIRYNLRIAHTFQQDRRIRVPDITRPRARHCKAERRPALLKFCSIRACAANKTQIIFGAQQRMRDLVHVLRMSRNALVTDLQR